MPRRATVKRALDVGGITQTSTARIDRCANRITCRDAALRREASVGPIRLNVVGCWHEDRDSAGARLEDRKLALGAFKVERS